MTADVLTTIVIRRPRTQVAAYATDPDNAPAWYANIVDVEWQTPRPLRQGSRVRFRARFLGRTLSYVYEVTDFEPGHRLVMRTREGPFPMETSYRFADEGPDATRMTLRNRGEPHGFSALLAPFVRLAMRRENRKDLSRLKRLLEAPRPAA